MTGSRGSYAVSRSRIGAGPWIALTPFQLRAEWARSPCVRDLDAQRALAAGLDDGVGRLHQDREVGLASARGRSARAGCRPLNSRVDLLGLVEDEGDVAVGLGHGRGEPQDDRVAALHVAGAEAVQQVAVAAAAAGCR